MEIRKTDKCGMVIEEVVQSPSHYTQGDIECIDALRSMLTPDEWRGFLKGTVMTYLWRLGHKDDPVIEAGKLAWYASWLKGVDPRV